MAKIAVRLFIFSMMLWSQAGFGSGFDSSCDGQMSRRRERLSDYILRISTYPAEFSQFLDEQAKMCEENCRLTPTEINVLRTAVENRVKALSLHQIYQVSYIFDRLQRKLRWSFWEESFAIVNRELNDGNAIDVSHTNFIFNQAQFNGIAPNAELMKLWSRELTKQAPNLSPTLLTFSLKIFYGFRFQPTAEMSEAFLKHISITSSQMDPKRTALAVFELGRLGIPMSSDLVSKLIHEFRVKRHLAKENDIALFFFGLYLNDQISKGKAITLLGMLEERLIRTQDENSKGMLGQVSMYLRLKYDIKIRGIEKFEKFIHLGATRESYLEEKFRKELDARGISYKQEYLTAEGFSVDFYVPDLNLIFQVDGDRHMLTNLDTDENVSQNRDIRINEILRLAGYKVERVMLKPAQ